GTISIASYTASFYNTLNSIEFPALVRVEGNLDIQTSHITHINGFKSLEYVGGRLYLFWLPKVENIQFPVLKEVGVLTLQHATSTANQNAVLTNLDGFSTLERVSSVTIRYHRALESFEGLAQAYHLSLPEWDVRNNRLYNPTSADMDAGEYVYVQGE
ncbi:MAG: hypothetical protein LIP01_07815, partial [Tannerellaceae bacterium]|nr:hypothetical protein [Tannerellaceae bacterium]